MDIDEHPPLSVGARIKLARTRAGMTRPVLGNLVGRSADWVKAVESDRIYPPRLPMLGLIASILKVRVSDLVGDSAPSVESLIARKHPALQDVRDALNGVVAHTANTAVDAAQLEQRLLSAWRARHGAGDHRTVLGKLLPDLLADVDALAAQRHAMAGGLVAEVLGLAQMYLAYQSADLVWRVVDRGLVNAADNGTPEVVASGAWFAAQAHRDVGEWDTALNQLETALVRVTAGLDDESSQERVAWAGALNAEAAIVCARSGQEGRARYFLDRAAVFASDLHEGFMQRQTYFSRSVMPAHQLSVAVELGKNGEARQCAQPIHVSSRPRRARHLIECARAYVLNGDYHTVLRLLKEAHATAAETVQFNLYARKMILDATDSGTTALRRDASAFAVRIGFA